MSIKLKRDEEKIKAILDFYKLSTVLKDLERTGWKRWGVKRRRVESVAEHIYGTCMLALAVWSETLPEVNISEVITMLVLHETEEIVIGDITPYDNEKKLKIKENGEEAVQKIFSDLIARDAYFKLVHDFDERKTPEAIFAHKCDKLECDLMARLYSDEDALKNEYADNIKQDKRIEEFNKNGIYDVADYFALTDTKHFKDKDDIFNKINKYIVGKKIWGRTKKKTK